MKWSDAHEEISKTFSAIPLPVCSLLHELFRIQKKVNETVGAVFYLSFLFRLAWIPKISGGFAEVLVTYDLRHFW